MHIFNKFITFELSSQIDLRLYKFHKHTHLFIKWQASKKCSLSGVKQLL